MCSVCVCKVRWGVNRLVCQRYVGNTPISNHEVEEEAEPEGVWRFLVNDSRFHLGQYYVFVVWLLRTYGEKRAFFLLAERA